MEENLPPTLRLLDNIRRTQDGLRTTASLWSEIECHIKDAEQLIQRIKQKIASLNPMEP